jgi:hypothetical protein
LEVGGSNHKSPVVNPAATFHSGRATVLMPEIGGGDLIKPSNPYATIFEVNAKANRARPKLPPMAVQLPNGGALGKTMTDFNSV